MFMRWMVAARKSSVIVSTSRCFLLCLTRGVNGLCNVPLIFS